MNIAICDDNIEYINTMENYLDQFQSFDIDYDIFMYGEELVQAYENGYADYDAIFLDMEMGKLDDIQTANMIRKIDKHVIIVFITCHKKYMQRSFECSPFRFLLKPIEFSDFNKVYNQICTKLNDNPEVLIFLENKKRTRLYCSDIIFFESSSHWLLIHTRDGKIHKIRKTMSELFSTIQKSNFARVHRAFVVNLSYIHQISNMDIIMHYYDKPVPIGKNYKKDFTDKFLNFKERKYLL